MAAVAVTADTLVYTEDPFELHELLHLRTCQVEDGKPISPRGRSRLRRPTRRVRGARCRIRRPRTWGHRLLATEQSTRVDGQVLESEDDDPVVSLPTAQERKCYRRYRKREMKAQQREIQVDAAVRRIEEEIREELLHSRPDIEARCRFLRDYLEFFDGHGSEDHVSQEVLDKHRLELIELEAELLLLSAA